MTTKQPQVVSGKTNLAEAIVASGLIKNAKLADKLENPKSDDDQSPRPKKIFSKRSQSTLDMISSKQFNQAKPSNIEDILIDRQLHPPLPKLRPEGVVSRDYSGASSVFSSISDATVSDISFLYNNPPRHVPEPTNEEILAQLSTEEPITFPKTMLKCTSIGKNQIASRANFEQLNNLLHSLTVQIDNDLEASKEDRLVGQREAYDTVMTEIVRQGYFECSPKGELLQSVRDYMLDAIDEIPIMNKRMQKQKELAQQKITALQSENESLTDQNQLLQQTNFKLEHNINKMQQKIQFYDEKIPKLEEENRSLRIMSNGLQNKLNECLKDLADSQNEVIQMTKDRDSKAEMVESLSVELSKSNERQVTLTKQAEEATMMLETIKNDLRKEQIAKETVAAQLEEVRAARLSEFANINKSHKETQTEVYMKNKRKTTKPSPFGSGMTGLDARKKISDAKDDYQACLEALGEVPLSLTQFTQMKDIILERNGRFVLNTENIIKSENGDFELEGAPFDSMRLFAHGMMTRIMSRCVRSPAKTEATTQTAPLKDKFNKITIATSCSPSDFKSEYNDAFTKLLDPVYADRPPRPFEWIMKSIRSIFDEKTLKDSTDIQEGRSPMPMPQFALQWSTRQYGLSYLSHQCCWDLVNSARAHQFKAAEIELFRKFLDEDYSTQQLTFYLRVRTVCLRRGMTITQKSKESGDTYNEVFLTSSQAIDLMTQVFSRAGQTVIDDLNRQLRDHFVRRPSSTVDANLSYIAGSAVLQISVETFDKYEKNELIKLMNCVFIKPRLTSQRFTKTMIELVPTLGDSEIAELYRINNIVQAEKVEMKVSEFKKQFVARSLISKESGIDILKIENIMHPTEEYVRANQKWIELEPILDEVLMKAEELERDPNLTHVIQCLKVDMANVNSSLTCFDVVGTHKNILSCVLTYQTLLWTMKEPNPDVMEQLVSSIRDLVKI